MAAVEQRIALQEIRQRLQAFQFRELFVDLGWDHLQGVEPVVVDETEHELVRIAHKRGLQVFLHTARHGESIPGRSVRRRIDREISKVAQEHLLIFTDAANSTQLWQWARREPGKPLQHHEHELLRGQSGEALAQRVQRLYVSIEDEESLTIPDVVGRVRGGFDAERITKRFYDRFKQEHDAFRGFIEGIATEADRDWYASLMLNRLMFIYFIQKKGFLNHDQDYLRAKLAEVQAERGSGQFLSFYRHFLLRLFHQGLSQQESERPADLDALLGDVPYLNGGLFDVHTLEAAYADIDLPDEAFERLFDFFDAYRWHLDERPLRQDNEINPDVLGYIFEKYINQKQMGAYYTKEDITGYISRNTIIPALFDMARKDVTIAFRPDSAMWRLLQENPDRYIYPAMQKGTDLALPADIAAGVGNVAERLGWNRPAGEGFALPTETWREHVARRQRHDEIWQRLVDGEIHEIDDLITLNLDIHQFAVDVIAECEGPETLRAFWSAISRISVLDPTCGSGAFLFAALNILQPLAEACLERMQAFVDEDDVGDTGAGGRSTPPRYADFRQTLASVAQHENRAYFVIKQIVLNNLYGVDIMEEAVEICKLRLFLKLVAQVDIHDRIEPLPDIDFNIRVGNTLVGFASLEEVEKSLGVARVSETVGQMRMLEPETSNEIQAMREEAEKAAMAFSQFRRLQASDQESSAQRMAKDDVRIRLTRLQERLGELLARSNGVDPHEIHFAKWREDNSPLHWPIEYFEILSVRGGFDVIIGNPPYIELKEVRDYEVRGFECLSAGNLYALILERCEQLAHAMSRQGYIVPVSSVSTDRYACLQNQLRKRKLHFASFDDRPARLFDGLEHIRLTIHILGHRTEQAQMWSTNYNKWSAEEREALFSLLEYVKGEPVLIENSLPKLHSKIEHGIIQKLTNERATLSRYYVKTGSARIYYSRKVGYFLQILDFQPRVLDGEGNLRPPSEFKTLRFGGAHTATAALAALSSNLFYWFMTVFSDCRHLNKREIDSFPVNLAQIASGLTMDELSEAVVRLSKDLQDNSTMRTMRFKHDILSIQCIFPKHSKPIIDQIDRVLANHYGLTDEELDFIVNYDYKFRMGVDDAEA